MEGRREKDGRKDGMTMTEEEGKEGKETRGRRGRENLEGIRKKQREVWREGGKGMEERTE